MCRSANLFSRVLFLGELGWKTLFCFIRFLRLNELFGWLGFIEIELDLVGLIIWLSKDISLVLFYLIKNLENLVVRIPSNHYLIYHICFALLVILFFIFQSTFFSSIELILHKISTSLLFFTGKKNIQKKNKK